MLSDEDKSARLSERVAIATDAYISNLLQEEFNWPKLDHADEPFKWGLDGGWSYKKAVRASVNGQRYPVVLKRLLEMKALEVAVAQLAEDEEISREQFGRFADVNVEVTRQKLVG